MKLSPRFIRVAAVASLASGSLLLASPAHAGNRDRQPKTTPQTTVKQAPTTVKQGAGCVVPQFEGKNRLDPAWDVYNCKLGWDGVYNNLAPEDGKILGVSAMGPVPAGSVIVNPVYTPVTGGTVLANGSFLKIQFETNDPAYAPGNQCARGCKW